MRKSNDAVMAFGASQKEDLLTPQQALANVERTIHASLQAVAPLKRGNKAQRIVVDAQTSAQLAVHIVVLLPLYVICQPIRNIRNAANVIFVQFCQTCGFFYGII